MEEKNKESADTMQMNKDKEITILTSHHKKQLQEKNQYIQELQRDKELLIEDKQNLQSQIKSLGQQLAQKERSISDLNSKLGVRDQQINALLTDKGKVDLEKQNKHHMIQELNTQLQAKADTIQQLSKQTITFREQNDLLKQENQLHKDKLEAKTQEVQRVTKDLADLRTKYQGLNGQLKSEEIQSQDLDQKLKVMSDLVANKETQLKEMSDQKSQIERQSMEYRQQKAELKAQVREIEKQLNTLVNLVEGKTEEEIDLKQKIEELGLQKERLA